MKSFLKIYLFTVFFSANLISSPIRQPKLIFDFEDTVHEQVYCRVFGNKITTAIYYKDSGNYYVFFDERITSRDIKRVDGFDGIKAQIYFNFLKSEYERQKPERSDEYSQERKK